MLAGNKVSLLYSAHWALLGSAIKVCSDLTVDRIVFMSFPQIAQNLGISRLGSESDGRTYPATWRSVVKRETARRVWWSLVCLYHYVSFLLLTEPCRSSKTGLMLLHITEPTQSTRHKTIQGIQLTSTTRTWSTVRL